MPDTGWISPGSVASATLGGSGSIHWSDAANAAALDAAFASVLTGNSGVLSHYLVATNFAFGLSSGVQILGIQTRYTGLASVSTGTIDKVTIVSSGSKIGTEKTPAQALTTSNAAYTFGGAADPFGISPLPQATVESSTFGVGFQCKHNGPGSLTSHFCDHIEMKIHFGFATKIYVI